MRGWRILVLALAAGCGGTEKNPGDTADCANPVAIFDDIDRDGVGGALVGVACEAGHQQATVGGDCDDTDNAVFPGQVEDCNGIDDDCDGVVDQGLEQHVFYEDLDGDTWGSSDVPLVACHAPTPDWTRSGGDCDDTDPAINPGGTEVCGGGDEDCDGLVDEDDDSLDGSTRTAWYPDRDLDGFGAKGQGVLGCVAPQAGYVDNGLDCADQDDLVNPNATEVCGGGDEDCDGLLDDFDDTVDPAGLLPFFADVDGDSAGDAASVVMLCAPRAGAGVQNDLDCDDANAQASPFLHEMLCDGVDNDCDPTTGDDADADLDGVTACVGDCNDHAPDVYFGAPEIPGDGTDQDCDGLEACFQDLDGDGARGTTPIAVSDPFCTLPGDLGPAVPADCDDTDPAVSWPGDWWSDADLDGYGDGVLALHQCADPGPGYALATGNVDCDDGNPAIHPSAPDPCNDGIDADCDASDSCADCAHWLASDPALPDGTYEIRPDGDPFDVWCDMTTDGGGWTLVSSTTAPPSDSAAAYYGDLSTPDPAGPHNGVWDGLRDLLPGTADVRFACKLDPADAAFTVDLSFYDVTWYSEVTTGTDAESCFSEGGNPDPPPARRDNLTGDTRPQGDPWNSGVLEGEDACNDPGDFTVDFDDRGMDGNQSDGTDWGSDDGKKKCGVSDAGGAWFLFAR